MINHKKNRMIFQKKICYSEKEMRKAFARAAFRYSNKRRRFFMKRYNFWEAKRLIPQLAENEADARSKARRLEAQKFCWRQLIDGIKKKEATALWHTWR